MARRERLNKLDIRPLSPSSRDAYTRNWEQTQARFVDDPAGTLGQADALIVAVMQERGYPMDDFEQRAADISVDHPDVVQHYRSAHDISTRVGDDRDGSVGSGVSNVSTEDMRQGFVHYRALFAGSLSPKGPNAGPPAERSIERSDGIDRPTYDRSIPASSYGSSGS